MKNKQKIKEIAKKILKSQKGIRSPQIMHPTREWLVGLLIAIIIFGSSAIWSVFMYREYKNVSITDGGANTETIVYRESLVNAALQEFSERQKKHNDLLNGVSNEAMSSQVEEVGSVSTTTELVGSSTASITDEISPDLEAQVVPPELVPSEGVPTSN